MTIRWCVAASSPAVFERSTYSLSFQTRFLRASSLAGGEFFERVDYAFEAWMPARQVVLDALNARKSVAGGDPAGRILVFDEFAAWKVRLSFPKVKKKRASDILRLNLCRTISSLWSVQNRSQRRKSLCTSFTQTRAANGASRQCPSRPRASRAAKRSPKSM